jgi:hypothetical protein
MDAHQQREQGSYGDGDEGEDEILQAYGAVVGEDVTA